LTSNARQHKIYKRGLEVVSKPQIRFKGKAIRFKGKAQADRESAAYMGVCEHLSEACNAAVGPQMGF
jgi:hypothetical protein